MKKFVSKIFFVFILSGCLYAQNSAVKANRNTAVRCLKLAENCLVSQDWNNALSQAELGLSYDSSISDLYYVKAAVKTQLGASRKEVIKIVDEAFQKDEWVDYTKNGARILLADLLCDTGKYEESLSVLDQEPFIYSADAEYIRIKNYYRLGTEESVNQARLKVNSSRRVYSTDLRFPNIFFMFESLIKLGTECFYGTYNVPSLVQNIAQSYIVKLPDYTGKTTELELMASMFANKDVQNRLVRAIDAKNQTTNPLLALCGLDCGLYSDQKAYELFFEYSGDSIYLLYLDYLASRLTDDVVRMDLLARMVNFEGTLVIDENYDLQNELTVKYELGRPKTISYDSDDDGFREIYSLCDYGTPQYVYFDESEIQLVYDIYPNVQKINFANDQFVFNFLFDDYSYTPFEMYKDPFFAAYDLELFVPYSKDVFKSFTYNELVQHCNSLEIPITERENAKVVYTLLNGEPVFAKFFEGENQYAFCDFEDGIPFIRYADYDLDSYSETLETYDFISSKSEDESIAVSEESSLRDPVFISSVFSDVPNFKNIYLKKIQIDRNANTFYEFTQEFLPNNGTVTLWDNNDDGIIDCRHTKIFTTDGESFTEESVFYNAAGYEYVSVTSINNIPLKLNYNGKDTLIFAGNNKNVYWIDMLGSVEDEKTALTFIGDGVEQGSVDIIPSGENRILVIRVGSNYFCRLLDEMFIYNLDNE